MMKRFLLIACLLPSLAFAQFPFLKRAASLSTKATLDSVYLFQGKDERLTDINTFTYDEQGRKKQMFRKIAWEMNGELRLAGKVEYAYVDTLGGLCVKEMAYDLKSSNTWTITSRVLTYYNKAGLEYAMEESMPVEGEWKKTWTYQAVEYDGDRPTIVMDSTFNRNGSVDIQRMEAKYLTSGYADSCYFYNWEAESKQWIPTMRAKFTYNDQGLQASQYSEGYEDGAWSFLFEYSYKYDDRGNMTREEDLESFSDNVFVMRYQNYYSDKMVTHNRPVESLSNMGIRFNTGSRTVCVDLGESQSGTFRLLNASGVIVQSSRLTQSVSDIQMNTSGKGYHIIQIQTSKGVKTQSVIL